MYHNYEWYYTCFPLLTYTGPPLAPPPPKFSPMGPTSVALLLSDPPFSSLPITSYTIKYFISDFPANVTTITVSPGTVQVILTDVQTTQSYTVTVFASNTAGRSPGTKVPLPSFQVPGECESLHWQIRHQNPHGKYIIKLQVLRWKVQPLIQPYWHTHVHVALACAFIVLLLQYLLYGDIL